MGVDLLNMMLNNGPQTLISKELGARYPFLMEKMMYCVIDVLDPSKNTLQFAIKYTDGKLRKVEYNGPRVNNLSEMEL